MNDKTRDTEEPVLAPPPAENTDDPAPPPSGSEFPNPSVIELRQLERTDMLRAALLPKALKGDVRAVRAILKCDVHETKILAKQDVWRTPGECAAILGVSAKTISRAAERGELLAVKTNGGHRRIRREDLESYRVGAKKSDENKSDKSDKSDSVELESTPQKTDKSDKSDSMELEVAENNGTASTTESPQLMTGEVIYPDKSDISDKRDDLDSWPPGKGWIKVW